MCVLYWFLGFLSLPPSWSKGKRQIGEPALTGAANTGDCGWGQGEGKARFLGRPPLIMTDIAYDKRKAGQAELVPAAGPAHGLGAGAGAGRGRRGLGGERQRRGREAVEADVPRQRLRGWRGPGEGTGWALGGGRGLAGGGTLAPAAPRPVPLPAASGRRRGPGQLLWRRWRGAPAAAGAEGRGAREGQRCPCGGERGRSGGMSPPPDPTGWETLPVLPPGLPGT